MNVLLDLDGTLTDSRPGIVACIQYALRSLGHDAPEESALMKYIGPPLKAAFGELLPAHAHTDADRAIAAYRERYVPIGMYENTVYAGIPEALQMLRDAGARLFVATSKAQVYAVRILDHFGLSHHFEEVYGSELDGRLAHKGELIAHVLSSAKLGRSDTTMVGDRHHDAVAAVANGVRAVGVLWGYGSRAELLSAGAQVLLDSPSELQCLALGKSAAMQQSPSPC